MTARQLAAAAELEHIVAERRAPFAVQQFAQRRRAGKRGWAKRRAHEPEC
jgi:hypothetical protein